MSLQSRDRCKWYPLCMSVSMCINVIESKALDKREYLVIIRDNFCQYCIVTPHLNCLNKMILMRGHNVCLH